MQQQKQTLLLLSAEQMEAQFQQLQRDFAQKGYQTYLHTSIQAAEDYLNAESVDAIITDDSHPALTFVQDVDEIAFDIIERPLLCIITAAASVPKGATVADVIVPHVSADLIAHSLKIHFDYRARLSQHQQVLNETNLLKNAIVRNVSHELKTPLLQVKSAVALIAEDTEDTLTQMAVTATARLETVVKNITLLADSLNGNFGPVLISESIDQAMRNLRRSWEHRNDIQRIAIHLDDQLSPVVADRQGLGIVLQQLMDNALKFSKQQQTPVEVRAARCDAGTHIAVRDYGIGIAEDKLKQIFETFYQVDNSTTRRYGGTGVGLSIVRLILEKHNVEIHVESQLGKGSTFSFTLPEADL